MHIIIQWKQTELKKKIKTYEEKELIERKIELKSGVHTTHRQTSISISTEICYIETMPINILPYALNSRGNRLQE